MTTDIRSSLVAGAVLMIGVASAHAQSPADDFTRRQEEQTQSQRLDALRRATPGGSADKENGSLPAGSGNGACFDIMRVEIDGANLLSAQEIGKVTAPYGNRCVGLAEINAVLRDVTHLYIDHGYVTSRAYVPQQDIRKTRILRLLVVEGTLSDIYLNGQKVAGSGWLATAFPGLIGRVVNIRDIEQGLDQMNRLQANDAKSAMLPGPKDGTSILNIENRPGRPWHASIGNNNMGQESTGFSRSSASLTFDDLLDINDQWSFSYEHSGPNYPWSNDGKGYGNSYSGSVSVPYGYSTVSLNGSWYQYESAVEGNFSSLETSGNSGQAGLGIDRVVLRDKDSITTVRSSLTYKQTNNFLLGNLIEVGSRRYTVGEIGVSHSRRMFGGIWVFDASYDKGLGLFDAVEPGDPGAGNADPRYSKFNATISVTQPFQAAGRQFELTSLLSGQYSPDNLLGAEQISLGSYSNVRGTRESVLFGNNGMFSHNEIVWRTKSNESGDAVAKVLGELRPYLGLDYGHVYSQKRFDMTGGDLASWTAGIRAVGGNISSDLGYSDIVASSLDHVDGGLFYFSASTHW
ncbi:ShlB/FhaC/HecB family hemolysin secretion/activation protein [Rhizobium ruizarguesonis]|uniref:ShlB/FhaC/HecB family hemolysin secretion/activation protein n=1 Tax=Rhizobium ruizarguesonis TaxID=2081791 RepID=UPI0010304CE3|nr:ShlB/FhaC/HecB family hemolysin secretion/activation protein [Rhizobium ruizarguesonis]TAZ66882.1 ShlB/FhaC/HecB family hemolysin secretion/activation protein [Rhizobium ruizarguesonis]TAZ89955.1 ShlB/FhaC/HecB family hemolysin secretion/activation protein [Rhizobium ruizarguesonis]TBA10654.1 ShlB/FhaC/HecB family hemolysin secretion/activation protein [Rhizobium ruizarguesonis]TBA54052.1 ShlB/FhaC/HecB family hemolysin secretion/activation protein [Rhizobium ruizarguesonis]TBB40554.1 ShlB/